MYKRPRTLILSAPEVGASTFTMLSVLPFDTLPMSDARYTKSIAEPLPPFESTSCLTSTPVARVPIAQSLPLAELDKGLGLGGYGFYTNTPQPVQATAVESSMRQPSVLPIEIELEAMLDAFRYSGQFDEGRIDDALILPTVRPGVSDDTTSVSSSTSCSLSISSTRRERTEESSDKFELDHLHLLDRSSSITVMSPPVLRTHSGRMTKRRRRLN